MTLRQRLCDNLVATYAEVAMGLPGARHTLGAGYEIWRSIIPHPAGNFAARLKLDPWAAAELRGQLSDGPGHVLTLPEDQPSHLAELLRRAGFQPRHSLALMTDADADPVDGEYPLASLDDRFGTARFMMDRFFVSTSEEIRESLAQATANADLAFYGTEGKERTAVAINRAHDVFGLYNLCVSRPQSGKGLGRQLVMACRQQAEREGLTVVLQCEPSLESWYERLGFQRVGSATVWA